MNEGLMVKDPENYTPGRRGLSWFKLKKELATLDVVVVALNSATENASRSSVIIPSRCATRSGAAAHDRQSVQGPNGCGDRGAHRTFQAEHDL